jgi:hypothetical protein
MPKTVIGRVEASVAAIAAVRTLVHVVFGASGNTADDYWGLALLVLFVVALVVAFEWYGTARQTLKILPTPTPIWRP